MKNESNKLETDAPASEWSDLLDKREFKLSDHDIDIVLKAVAHCWEQTKEFKGSLRKKYFLDDLHRLLHNKQSGMLVGVCPNCFGSGYQVV